MRKKIINVLSVVMFVCMLLPKNVYAATGGGSVTVGTGSVYVTGVSGVHRTGDYSYVSVKANSVYPTEDKKDNYTTCKVRLYQMIAQAQLFHMSIQLKKEQGIQILR